MKENIIFFIYGIGMVVFGVLGVVVGYSLRRKFAEAKVISAEKMAKKILEDATKEVETKKKEAIIEAKDKLYRLKSEFEEETRLRRVELSNMEKRLTQREDAIDRKADVLERKEKESQTREKEWSNKERGLKEKEEKLSRLLEEERKKLENISGLTPEGAKKLLMSGLEEEAKLAAARTIKQIEDEAKETAATHARKIISLAIERCAMNHTVETTVSVVPLPNEEIKGRIIGREGRNIRALEAATGIDLIVDDTPEAVLLSGFDLMRREIAHLALDKLIADGRIHPARIEEVVARARQEIENKTKEIGEHTVLELGISGIHPQLVRTLGRLKYRTSYGHNVLQHSIETAYIAGLLASELGLDAAVFKRAGLLHDIGKAVDHEVEGTHPQIGADLARKFNEHAKIVQAIADHHGDDPQRTIEAVIVQAADAISGSRPGARRENLETYIKRMTKLEDVAASFGGVSKTFAIQAGREIRIMVDCGEINDAQAATMARDIAKRIEQELEYPGQIKVTVIREMRAVEYAK